MVENYEFDNKCIFPIRIFRLLQPYCIHVYLHNAIDTQCRLETILDSVRSFNSSLSPECCHLLNAYAISRYIQQTYIYRSDKYES